MEKSIITLCSNVQAKLFTKEDFLHIHKLLGVSVLMSFLWRFSLIGSSDMGFATAPQLTMPTLLLHFALNVSAFHFTIPTRRISEGSRIWPEYRWHALIFTTRSLCTIALYAYEQYYQLEPNYWANYIIAIGTMIAADVVSFKHKQHSSNTIRKLDTYASIQNSEETINSNNI